MLKYLFAILLFSYSVLVQGQNFNRPVPQRFVEYEFVIHDTADLGYYFTCPNALVIDSTVDKCAAILDTQGYIAWYAKDSSRAFIDLKYHEDFNVFSFARLSNFLDYQQYIMDTSFQIIDSIGASFGYFPDVHEFDILENGHYLMVMKKDSTMDLSAYTFDGGVPGSATTNCKGFVIRELDSAKNIVFEWNSNNHMHPTECIDSTYGYSPVSFDYAHGNSVEEDSDGNFLVSFRHTNSILKIDRTTGSVLWRLGGRLSDFTLTNDLHGFSGQHDVRRLPNGNISMFDNMNSKTPAPIRSRALELQIDTASMTATKVWRYRYLPGFEASAMGSYQRLPNNYHIMGYGRSFRPNPSVVVVDSLENQITTIYFRDSTSSYRTKLYDLPFEIWRPEITCSNVAGVLTLIAPSGFSNYVWSTGETTNSIAVSDTGTYQVWVNKGIGMLGSNPYRVSDTTGCMITEIRPVFDSTEEAIVAIYDMLGRTVNNPQLGGIYVIRYQNGRTALRNWNFLLEQRYRR